MKRKFGVLMALLLVMTLMFAQVAFAAPKDGQNGNVFGKTKMKMNYGQLKKLEPGTFREYLNDIRINGKPFKSDMPPVLKGYRTLVPVRAITEALGCTVKWFAPFACVVTPDEEKMLIFDLSAYEDLSDEENPVYMVYEITDETDEGEELIELVLDEDFTEEGFYPDTIDNSIDDYEEFIEYLLDLEVGLSIDVGPALNGNRTFVPLRLLSERLCYKVDFHPDSGEIDIDEIDRIDPDEVTFESKGDIEDVDIEVDETDTELKGLYVDGDELEEGEDYVTSGALEVTILEEFIEKLEEKETVVEFDFKGVPDEDFIINLDFINEDPELDPEEAVIDEDDYDDEDDDDYVDLIIKVTLNGYEFDKIILVGDGGGELNEGPNEGTDPDDDAYNWDEDDEEIVFYKEYLSTLDVGDYKFLFLFDDGDTELVEFELEVEE